MFNFKSNEYRCCNLVLFITVCLASYRIFACVFSVDGVPLRAAQVKKNVFGPQKGGDGSAVRAGDDRQQLHLAVADSAVVWKAVYEQQQKQQQQVEAKGGKSGKAAAAKMPLAAQNPAQSPQKQAPIGMR